MDSSQKLIVYFIESFSHSGAEKSGKLKCSGSTLGLMKLHGRCWIRCRLCILPYSLVERMFWHMSLVFFFGTCLRVMFGICTYAYGCKHDHELCYKDPISGMGVISLLCYTCYVVMLGCFSA